ncbi:MAG: hypothetical protein IKW39_02535 [Alphaproteobacteria bacterium]|nr:hypothetical protein [Alphaproteobacteria bacterium]
MKKSLVILASLLFGALVLPSFSFAAPSKAKQANKAEEEATTRQDAVIFKVHDITPVTEEGVVTGCDFAITLFNRTSVNFRSFTVNLNWTDPVDERFKFDRYVEAVMPKEELDKFKDVLNDEVSIKPVATKVTVNAFGANKQISVRSHIESEKCYLMLSDAQFSVTPCDIARSIDNSSGFNPIDQQNDCSHLFQFVSTKNPEYYGKFKNISATEEAKQNEIMQNHELEDIDTVIGKIVDNMGVSGNTLTNIN